MQARDRAVWAKHGGEHADMESDARQRACDYGGKGQQ